MKAPAFQPLGKQAHAQAVVPQNLDQRSTPAAEHEQVPAVRIAPQRLLHQQRKTVETLAHVGVAGRQPHPCPARNRDRHRRALARAATAVDTIAGSTAPVIRRRAPQANSISIMPAAVTGGPAAGAIVTAANVEPLPARPHRSRRQRYNWLVWMPAARATSDAIAPGSSDAATIRSFSARRHRRRRSNRRDHLDAAIRHMTIPTISHMNFAARLHLRKAALTGRLP